MREHDEARMRVHELARLIGFSVNDPGKIPDFEATATSDKATAGPPVSSAVDNALVRGFFIALAMQAGASPSPPVVLEEPTA